MIGEEDCSGCDCQVKSVCMGLGGEGWVVSMWGDHKPGPGPVLWPPKEQICCFNNECAPILRYHPYLHSDFTALAFLLHSDQKHRTGMGFSWDPHFSWCFPKFPNFNSVWIVISLHFTWLHITSKLKAYFGAFSLTHWHAQLVWYVSTNQLQVLWQCPAMGNCWPYLHERGCK